MNFVIAVTVFGETVSQVQAIGYGIILVALALFNYPNFQKIRLKVTG